MAGSTGAVGRCPRPLKRVCDRRLPTADRRPAPPSHPPLSTHHAPLTTMLRGAFTSALGAYTAALRRRPIPTQVASSAVLWALGDAAAQRVEGGPLDARRLAVTTAWGGAFNGTVGHLWYIWLDAAARRRFLPGSARFIAAKVAADCLVFGPLHVAGFFAALTLGEGGSLGDVQRKIARDLPPVLAAELSVWPWAQAANFYFVPLQYQLLVVNSVTLFDATFMSYSQHHNLREELAALAERVGLRKKAAAAAEAPGGGKNGGPGRRPAAAPPS